MRHTQPASVARQPRRAPNQRLGLGRRRQERLHVRPQQQRGWSQALSRSRSLDAAPGAKRP